MSVEYGQQTRISRLERVHNSRNGNPRYRVHFENGGSGLTKVDADFVYSLSAYSVGRSAVVSWRGNIITDITLV